MSAFETELFDDHIFIRIDTGHHVCITKTPEGIVADIFDGWLGDILSTATALDDALAKPVRRK